MNIAISVLFEVLPFVPLEVIEQLLEWFLVLEEIKSPRHTVSLEVFVEVFLIVGGTKNFVDFSFDSGRLEL